MLLAVRKETNNNSSKQQLQMQPPTQQPPRVHHLTRPLPKMMIVAITTIILGTMKPTQWLTLKKPDVSKENTDTAILLLLLIIIIKKKVHLLHPLTLTSHLKRNVTMISIGNLTAKYIIQKRNGKLQQMLL